MPCPGNLRGPARSQRRYGDFSSQSSGSMARHSFNLLKNPHRPHALLLSWRTILWVSQWLKESNVGFWFIFEDSNWLTASNQAFLLVNLKQAGHIVSVAFKSTPGAVISFLSSWLFKQIKWSCFIGGELPSQLFRFCCLKMHTAWLNPLPRPWGQLLTKMLVRKIFQCVFHKPF